MSIANTIKTSTPGRICLFGEHQDYLGLPVIAMAINKRLSVTGSFRADKKIVVTMPDLGEEASFDLEDLAYTNKRDYFKSGVRVLKDMGIILPNGLDASIKSDIPIQSGTSSSTAMVVGWIHLLLQLAGANAHASGKEIAALAHRAEVMEFNEPGGMMDHYSTSLGGLIYLESEPVITATALDCKLGTFVLGDSGEKKSTLDILQRCKKDRLKIMDKIMRHQPSFSLQECPLESIDPYRSFLNLQEMTLLEGTLKNRDLLQLGLEELSFPSPDLDKIGQLLTNHHGVLRDTLGVSTPKIERMLSAALDAGAMGGKINGTGGGGCMFALTPENPGAIANAIEQQGGVAHIIEMDEGTAYE